MGTVHDDKKLPEKTPEETSESKAPSNFEAERKILEEIQPEQKVQDSPKKAPRKTKKNKKLKSLPKYKKIEPDPVPNCECGVVAFGPKISKTRKNKGREYYCCGVTKSKVDS